MCSNNNSIMEVQMEIDQSDDVPSHVVSELMNIMKRPPSAEYSQNVILNILGENLSQQYVDEVMNILIEMSSTGEEEPDVGTKALDIFYSRLTQSVMVQDFNINHSLKIMEILVNRSQHVEHLDLRGTDLWGENSIEGNKLLRNLLTKCKNLVTLNIDYTQDDATVINLIFECCPTLRELTYSGVGVMNKDDLDKNTILHLLKTLELGLKSRSDADLVALILRKCPILEHINDYPYLGFAVEKFSNEENSTNLMLTELNDKDTNEQVLQAVARYCPLLELLHLDRPNFEITNPLFGLPSLTKLSITNFDKIEGIKSLIEIIGAKIKILKLMNAEFINLSDILYSCSRLEFLYITNIFIIKYDKEITLRFLKHLIIKGTSCYTGDFIQLFYGMRVIQNIEINYWPDISDSIIKTIGKQGSWKELQYFFCHSSETLTKNSIIYLLRYCPKLELIRGISNWDISDAELNNLKDDLINQNSVRLE